MSENWVVGNLQNALDTWNSKLNEIWTLITQTPETFKRWKYLECYCKYQWNSTSNWVSLASTVFFSWNHKNLSAVLQKLKSQSKY